MTVPQADLVLRAFNVLTEIRTAETVNELDLRVEDLLRDMGFPLFSWGKFFDPDMKPATAFWVGKWKSEWAAAYLEHGYGGVSMISREMLRTSSPYCWHEIWRRGLDKCTQNIVNLAREFGHNDGLFCPMREADGSYTAVALCGTSVDLHDPLIRIMAEVVAAYYGQEARRLFRRKPVGSLFLSPRQRECLAWVREGKSSLDISEILGVSVPTVDGHVAEACRKFGVRTRVQAVVEAYLSGQLDR
ncbi:MAG: LuxR family transcriptional regulator, quorum-sensing system regulator BjaR1 [Sphingomonadales bacterium]|jgi:LuxR family quorum-sensing system transcriptional regulator CciR|nr:LuxR family transcriptional regulator, quorum-sensing system regulator BjaR1 [Sphingomonadales bacterium]